MFVTCLQMLRPTHSALTIQTRSKTMPEAQIPANAWASSRAHLVVEDAPLVSLPLDLPPGSGPLALKY